MNAGLAMRMMSDLFWTGLLIGLPVLGITLVVGVIVNVLQVVTQVHEASLNFIPKLVTAGAALLVFGPWMLRQLVQFAERLWTNIPAMF